MIKRFNFLTYKNEAIKKIKFQPYDYFDSSEKNNKRLSQVHFTII